MDRTVEPRLVTELPIGLKQLARLAVRAFYSIEEVLIIDTLVTYPCLKEADIAELLHFEKKKIRGHVSNLCNAKFLEMHLKMETGPDGKTQKVHYYFINYKTLVNIIKYKLHMARKRIEGEERVATNRAGFKCTQCPKTYTDLEVDMLVDFATGDLRCTLCGSITEEDNTAMPKKDDLIMLAKFNEQLKPLYDLLQQAENIKLAPELLEPKPVDINTIKSRIQSNAPIPDGKQWSGEATRNKDLLGGILFNNISIEISDDDAGVTKKTPEPKALPIWLTESTVGVDTNRATDRASLPNDAAKSVTTAFRSDCDSNSRKRKKNEENIMSLLFKHEKKPKQKKQLKIGRKSKVFANSNACDSSDSSDSSDDGDEIENAKMPPLDFNNVIDIDADEDADIDADKENSDVPKVLAGGRPMPVDQINEEIIAQMTPEEKEEYIIVYQTFYSHLYD